MFTLTLTPVDLEGNIITSAFGELVGGGEYRPGESTYIQARPNSGYRFLGWTIDSDTSENIWKTTDPDYMISLIKNLNIKAILDPTGDWVSFGQEDAKIYFVNGAQFEDTTTKILKDSTHARIEDETVIMTN